MVFSTCAAPWSHVSHATCWSLQRQVCAPDNPDSCAVASRFSKVIVWISATIYVAGFFVAFLLGPILTRFDRS